ncbi:heterocyst frequency control protein PatD [Pleurocapsales cyanobacterium LEGE 10410]|nr:heterocyst frequency control protein PatD [Pleurocapsales cyanobacterium LEGE 10410]
MLPASHKRAYQDFLTLLKEFEGFLVDETQIERSQIQHKFQNLASWFERYIVCLNSENLNTAIAPRWQSVHTEIKREFRLLSTDILFLTSARQNATQTKRIKSIGDRLTKLLGYCQIMLNEPIIDGNSQFC